MARWHELLDEHLKARPHSIALRDSTGTCWSSAELDAASNGIAARLLDTGVRPGDRVAVLSGNCGPAVAAMAACSRLGAVAVPLEAQISAAELAQILDHCRPAAILFGTKASPEAAVHARSMQTRPLGGDWGRMLMACPFAAGRTEDSRLAAIFYRHASISPAPADLAGLMFSHESLTFAATEFAAIAGLGPGDQMAGTLPVSIASGFTAGILAGLVSGGSVMLENSFSPADLRASLVNGATHLLISHYILEKLAGDGAAVEAPALRFVATAAEISPASRALAEKAMGVTVQTGYVPGQSAGGVTVTLRSGAADGFPAGYPYDRTEVRIAPEPGQEGRGRIFVRGPQIMMGYYRNPELTRRFLGPDGWLDTGDSGWLDSKGRLHIAGEEAGQGL
jgi:acyl-CoA synthetase (AMP-forming)/AMP-acid ligase II